MASLKQPNITSSPYAGWVFDITELGFHDEKSILIYMRFPCASLVTFSYFCFLKYAQKWFWALCLCAQPGTLYAIVFIRASYEPNLDQEEAMVARVIAVGTLVLSAHHRSGIGQGVQGQDALRPSLENGLELFE